MALFQEEKDAAGADAQELFLIVDCNSWQVKIR